MDQRAAGMKTEGNSSSVASWALLLHGVSSSYWRRERSQDGRLAAWRKLSGIVAGLSTEKDRPWTCGPSVDDGNFEQGVGGFLMMHVDGG
ncbi:hypothetical protein ACJRO7_034281 [Eucalyptus globulus]|uniref:Uncharacterized protein n=1 Tax=Eucalyptus globulus TaxID=34317 RepID=A0ABD3J5W7_EUCGL